MLIAVSHQASNPIGVVIVVAVLYLVSRPIIRWVVEKEQNPWLLRILTNLNLDRGRKIQRTPDLQPLEEGDYYLV